MDHHQVARQDACVQHGLSPDPQGKILPGPAAGVKGQIVLDALLCQDRAAGRHVAHHRHLVFLPGGRPQRDGPALAGPLFDHAGLLQLLEMKVDGRGRPQPDGLSDLPHGGGIALLPDTGGNVFVDLLLHLCQFLHTRPTFARFLSAVYHTPFRKANICSIFCGFFAGPPPPAPIPGICLFFCKIPLKCRTNYGIINICEIKIHALHG